jgi:hypothetical protein
MVEYNCAGSFLKKGRWSLRLNAQDAAFWVWLALSHSFNLRVKLCWFSLLQSNLLAKLYLCPSEFYLAGLRSNYSFCFKRSNHFLLEFPIAAFFSNLFASSVSLMSVEVFQCWVRANAVWCCYRCSNLGYFKTLDSLAVDEFASNLLLPKSLVLKRPLEDLKNFRLWSLSCLHAGPVC